MLFSLADCTIDLLFVIVGYLDDKDLAAFASASSFHLLAQHTLRQRGVRQDARSEAAAATTAPFGLGIVDRPRFLSPGERPETVALVSYPRSGNSMLRGLIERVTGLVTGSDTRPDRVLSRSLLKKGLRGEGVVDDRAWIVKTHWPERYGYRRFPSHRVILLVRNPFDAINSYFNMAMTNTHDQTLKDTIYQALSDTWNEMVEHEIQIWAKFNRYWLTRGLPVLAVRYEDLLLHTEEMLVRLLAFLEKVPLQAVRANSGLMARVQKAAAAVKRGSNSNTTTNSSDTQAPSMSSSNSSSTAEKECERDGSDGNSLPCDSGTNGLISGRPTDPLHSNRPRSCGKIGASLRYYSSEQIDAMCKLEGQALRSFGYDPTTQNFPDRALSLPLYERCVKFVDGSNSTESNKGTCPSPPAAAAAAAGESPSGMVVNKGRQIRARDDKFGRNITKLRHELTDHDRRPLPTVAK